jgi:hypothetical protein
MLQLGSKRKPVRALSCMSLPADLRTRTSEVVFEVQRESLKTLRPSDAIPAKVIFVDGRTVLLFTASIKRTKCKGNKRLIWMCYTSLEWQKDGKPL